MSIQIYAGKKNFDTQKAERFFKERRVPYQLLDLKKHKLGSREMQLFARRLGAEILEALMENPRFLRTPIVRCGEQVTLGVDEKAWEAWIQKVV